MLKETLLTMIFLFKKKKIFKKDISNETFFVLLPFKMKINNLYQQKNVEKIF